MTRSSSSTYARWVHLLDPATIDRFDRFGHECSTSRCTALPTHAYGWRYVTGGRGRVSSAEKLVCTNHGIKFAAKHDLTMGVAQPPRTSMMDRVAADLATIGKPAGARIRVRVHKSRHGSWYLGYSCADESSMGESFWPLTAILPTAALDEAIVEAENYLAWGRQLVPAGPWERTTVDATTTLVDAWQAEPWRSQMWTFTVALQPQDDYDQQRGRTGMWTLTRSLHDWIQPITRFQPFTNELGWHNMTLQRAIDTAADLLRAQRWLVVDDEWSTTHPEDAVSYNHGWHPDQLRRVLAPQVQPC